MSGQVDNRYGQKYDVDISDPELVAEFALKQDKALTGQAAPTTATVGYLGQVVFDADGNKWECTAINGSVYTWTVGASGGLSVVCIPCTDMKGGTAPAYQSVVVSGYPYIVKKFLNATTNTAYFDICLPQIKAGSTVRY